MPRMGIQMDPLQQAFPKPLAPPLSRANLWEHWIRTHHQAIALTVVAFGFLLRVREAWGTFLNPDEALHFLIANRSSLEAAYTANLTMAHPPLLVFVLYGLRSFGSSEFVVRLPSILTGTLFCWIFFKWLTRILGAMAGLIGLIFMALLPPMVSVTAQVRQYGLLLAFAMSGAWFLEGALEVDSPGLMLMSAGSLWLAMLSHYSAFLFTATLGVYAVLRLWQGKNSARTLAAWTVGQLVALSLAVFLYLTHISKITGTTMAEQAFDVWLRKSYFHRGYDNSLIFLVTRTFSFFQYLFGQLTVGDVVALLFVAGIVILLRGKIQTSTVPRFAFAVLLILPFGLNYGVAVLDVYPFGGTRHCVYLSIFAIAGITVCMVKVTGRNPLRAIAISAIIVALCFAFRTTQHPYLSRTNQNRANMYRAIGFVREQIPESDPILVDYESGIELGHYLCRQKPISTDGSIPGFLVFHCGGHRVISTIPDVWAFTPSVFLEQWSSLVRGAYLKPGETVWVAQAGWMVDLDEKLRRFSQFHDLKTQAFGNNLRFFEMRVGQTMPRAAS